MPDQGNRPDRMEWHLNVQTYLHRLMRSHGSQFFTDSAVAIWDRTQIHFVTLSQAAGLRERCIAIPIDITTERAPQKPYSVAFNGTDVAIWNQNPRPDSTGWRTFPDESRPLWYCHDSGTLIPAWNLYANSIDLLTMREELHSRQRDRHGRFVAAFSSRKNAGMLETPDFNDAVAVLMGAALGLAAGEIPHLDLPDMVKPPVIVLSHDCDILLGNDFWTQLARLYRLVEPLRRIQQPRLSNLRWIWHNARSPRKYYFDSVSAMINMENQRGFKSTFYLLNGTGGRYGARSGSQILQDLIPLVPEGWDIGMHYNYDTHLSANRFETQKRELEKIAHREIHAGRAHYLRLDPDKSFEFWSEQGIEIDESVGYPDRIGYRCGIAGCFPVFDAVNGRETDMWEIPMTVMDTTLLEQYGADAIAHFELMLRHLAAVGGALTLNLHTGMIDNPEFPESHDFYNNLLNVCHEIGATSVTSVELAKAMKHGFSQKS
jgi:hypothetical protein